jgi:hypothetical protein
MRRDAASGYADGFTVAMLWAAADKLVLDWLDALEPRKAPRDYAEARFEGLLETLRGTYSSGPWPETIPPRPRGAERDERDRLPTRGRNVRIGCEQYDSGTWIHGRPHDCPAWARR